MSTEDAWYIAERLREILQSEHFNKDDFYTRPLKLSQAFCLLWQNKDSGDVSGRLRAGRTTNAAVVAVLLDLFVLRKIEFDIQVKQWVAMRRKMAVIYVKVIDPTRTGTYLDKALFSDILSHHSYEPSNPKTLIEWIMQGSCLTPTCATLVLESLVVEAQILGKTSVLFWKKYPTLNPEPETKLVEEVRKIALMGHIADGYMWTLIKLLSDVETSPFRKGSLLIQHFTPGELPTAKSRFDSLTHVEDELRISGRKVDEMHELQEMKKHCNVYKREVNHDKEEDLSAFGAAASCTTADVNFVIEKEESNSGLPEKSKLLKDSSGKI